MANILIVEDEGVVAKDIELTLRHMGHQVATAGCAESALRKVGEHVPDIVLMDIHLAGERDGISLAAEIRRDHGVPVVYLTAFADAATVERAKRTEPYGYIVKPFSGSELRSTVEVALYKHEVNQKLIANEARLATTLSSIGDGVIATDERGRIERMNPAAERLTGWGFDEARGHNVAEVCQFVSEESVALGQHPALRALAGGAANDVHTRCLLRSRDGQLTAVSQRTTPLRDAKGAIHGAVLVLVDMSRHRKKEIELEATRTRLQNLLTANPAIIYTRAISPQVAFTFISEDIKTQLGYEPAQLRDHVFQWRDKIHPGDREVVEATWANTPPDASGTCEFRFLHADGTYRWLHDAFRTVVHRDSAPEVVGCLIDITERKNNEDLLARQTRRLERSNKELEEFAYVASHDLRAPLRAIDTLSEWIQTDLGDALTGETREQMRLLRGRVKRMDRLLSDLLEYARVGRDELSVEFVDTRELLLEVIDLSSPMRSFRFDIDPKMPAFETGKVPLKRVFLNLINNAVKHHERPDGMIRVDVKEGPDFYTFSVTDDGPGVPEPFRERIFQMFQTLRPRDTIESSGMGLAIVRRIVESANGKVWVESASGSGGARFVFTWPCTWPAFPISRSSVPPSIGAAPIAARSGGF